MESSAPENQNLLRVAAELAKRQAAIADLSQYRSFLAASGHSDFRHPPALHHQVILSALQRMADGDLRRLMILAPPGSAKSTYASIQFPTHYLAKNPSHRVITASNTQTLAEEFNFRRRSACQTDEWQLLSQTRLDPKASGLTEFKTELGGGIRAVGVGSSISGFRSHLNVLDDPVIGVEQALSPTQLDKMWKWFLAELRSRLVPGGAELLIMTRWARYDLAGHILDLIESGEEPDWEVIRLPMLCDDAEHDPIGREYGERLWPEHFSEREHVTAPQRDPLMWASLYQQRPLDESGSWVGESDIKLVERAAISGTEMKYVFGVDLALSVGQGDFSVIVVAGICPDRNIYVVDVWRDRVSPEQTVQKLYEMAQRYRPTVILQDNDPAAQVFMRMVVEIGRHSGDAPLPLRPRKIGGKDKETRAAAIRGWFLSGRVFLLRSDWTADLMREILAFPAGKHDDQIDALGLIGRELVTLQSNVSAPEKTILPEESTAVFTDDAGRMFTRATFFEMADDYDNTRPRFGRNRI